MIVTTSWDDGHILDIKLAELLDRYNLPATFYIAPANRQIPAGKRLDEKQIRELSKRYEIGAHTMTHPKLSEVSDETARREMADSKKTLEGYTESEVKSFCYPSGDFLPKHEAMAKDAGFSLARTVRRFAMDIGSDPFALPTTIHAYRHWSNLTHSPREYFNWDDRAITWFNKTKERDGVFHLWGHSWEIEKNRDWNRLERVFKYISNRGDIHYMTNGQLLP